MQGFNCDDFDPEQVGGFPSEGSPRPSIPKSSPSSPDAKGGNLAVDFEILRATVLPGQEGKVHQEEVRRRHEKGNPEEAGPRWRLHTQIVIDWK